MPRLPNFLIHASAFIRPHLLRPDIRVPNIGYVDFAGLRSRGYNAVVIDKDNCVTLPNVDEVYPPFQDAWNELLRTFPPGRVLVVSNSAGTKKDPGGIAAEAVSLNLRAPVLMRQTPKPGCSPEIIAYFRGHLGQPTTLRGRLHDENEAIRRREKQDEEEIMGKYIEEMERLPLLGGQAVASRRGDDSKDGTVSGEALDDKMALHQASSALNKAQMSQDALRAEEETITATTQAEEPLRILVIGDRLFTDTLLAHRLAVTLPKATDSLPTTLSIHTTTLPQPKDVRFLRWVEDKLSGGRLKEGKTDWGRYIRDPYAALRIPPLAEIEAEKPATIKDKWRDLKEDVRRSTLRWDPRTWTLFDLVVGGGRGLRWMGRGFVSLVRQDGEVLRQAMKEGKAGVTVGKAEAAGPAEMAESVRAEEVKEVEVKTVPVITAGASKTTA